MFIQRQKSSIRHDSLKAQRVAFGRVCVGPDDRHKRAAADLPFRYLAELQDSLYVLRLQDGTVADLRAVCVKNMLTQLVPQRSALLLILDPVL